jgi:uncharacterized protein YggE
MISAALGAALAATASANPMRTVAVPGSARVQVAPNVAHVNLSLVGELPVTAELAADRVQLSAKVAELKAAQAARVAEVKESLKALVGAQGQVTATSRLESKTRYNRETSEHEFVGYELVTRVAVELRGRGAIEQKLDRLFDAATAKADRVDDPVLSVSDRSRASAERRALKRAVANARRKAEAALEPGERLGAIVDRVTAGAHVPGPRPAAGMRSAAAMQESVQDSNGGGGLIETGKQWVSAAANFVFEVLGSPARLGQPNPEPRDPNFEGPLMPGAPKQPGEEYPGFEGPLKGVPPQS